MFYKYKTYKNYNYTIIIIICLYIFISAVYFDTNNFWYISKWCSHVRHLVVVIFIGPELLAGVTEFGGHVVYFPY